MKDGACPKCGSSLIYTSNSPFPDSIFVKSSTSSIVTLATHAFICLDCGHLEMYVSDMSATLFGKGKSLKESIRVSRNLEKV